MTLNWHYRLQSDRHSHVAMLTTLAVKQQALYMRLARLWRSTGVSLRAPQFERDA